MPTHRLYLWNQAPALRLLLPFAAGIALQWYVPFSITMLAIAALICCLFLATFYFIPVRKQYVLKPFWGFAITALLVVAGAAAVWANDVRNSKDWFGHHYGPQHFVLATLAEPPVEKKASYKTLVAINAIGNGQNWQAASGKAILYFKKEAAFQQLTYGQQVVITKPLQAVKNSGNPGSFNYKRYALFQGITHQGYATAQDVVVRQQAPQKDFKTFLFRLRASVITIIKTYIKGPQESGLAEALLIGYKDDLDKTLLQAYANTGVVHVIAISGLHLGLLYGLLLLLTQPLRGNKWAWLRALLVVSALWLFTLLAGAQASIVRSAVMFTAIALGQVLNRKGNIYNTLALSALLLLLYNPFWLWDVGFQLSYAALLSIMVFYKPIYNWLFFQNKALDAVWKLMAVTLAAQILTTPFSLYYFHQFPLLFFITNLVAVPLSTLILFGEILLVLFSFMPPVALGLGWLLQQLIYFLNMHILQLNSLPFASWQNISISFWQAVLMLAFVAGMGYWLLRQQKWALQLSMAALLLFIGLRTASFITASGQKKIIVYNIPRHQAIDVIDGRNFLFIGDAQVEQDAGLYNYHLLPARVQHRAQSGGKMPGKAFHFYNHKILVIDSTRAFQNVSKPFLHLLVLSKNPKVYMHQLQKAFTIKQVVIDASVPAWKAALWQRDCATLKLNCHNVAEKGAFVMTL